MMRCDQHERYEMGNIDEAAFRRHLEECRFCRDLVEQDARLMSLVQSLKQPISSEHLWERIRRSLEAEQVEREEPRVYTFWRRAFPILRVAAVLIAAVVLGVMFWPKKRVEASGLLTQSALERVEQREQAYVRAIAELESLAKGRLTGMDVELALLYRDRLETIDAQVERCREALTGNPANAHIRRYMLAALQDKKETLNELLES
ncbi:MAG: hypothetical protein ABIL68_08925 [bacterium]